MPFKTNFRSEVMPDGKVVVYDVPIFAVCEKQGIQFTEEWIDKAISYHQSGEGNGMAWAMHIHHTGEDGRTVLPAGAFHNTRKSMIRTKDGEQVPGVICDLVFLDEDAARRAKLGQLLWRSPEIPMTSAIGEKPPRFKSLALLDRDAPHNDDLPILTFKGSSVRFHKKVGAVMKSALAGGDPVIAFADTADSIFALMEPTAMSSKTRKPVKTNTPAVLFEDDETPAPFESEGGESESEGGESKSGGWQSKIDALKACKIEAEDIPEFLAALKEMADALGGESEEEDAPIEETPELDETLDGPADPLEDMPMRDTADVIRLRDELVSLRADLIAEKKLRQQKDLEADIEKATDRAADLLKFKGVTREEIISFAEDEPLARRAAAIEKFAAKLDAKLLARDADFEDHIDFHASGRQDVPDEVMKFQADGPETYETALGQYRMWKQQPEDRQARIPLGRWLEINMPSGTTYFANHGG